MWEGRANNLLQLFEDIVVNSTKAGATQKVWTFWNSMFYCGTIYTTIGRYPYAGYSFHNPENAEDIVSSMTILVVISPHSKNHKSPRNTSESVPVFESTTEY